MAKPIDAVGGTTLPDVQIPASGNINRGSLLGSIQEVEAADSSAMALAEELAFMEEPVKIYLHETTSPTEEQLVFCAVNGEPALPANPYLRRGQEHVVKRKYVLNLATAKATTYTQPFGTENTERANTLRPHRALKYPFSVVEDTPKGSKWLRGVLAA